MSIIDDIFKALDSTVIAEEVTNSHDRARMDYPRPPEIRSYDDFLKVIGDYYMYHQQTCVSIGGSISPIQAEAEAERILIEMYQIDQRKIFYDAQHGTDGGIRQILDYLADYMKNRAGKNYSHRIYMNYVDPISSNQQGEVCQALFSQYGDILGYYFDLDHSEKHVHELEKIIFTIVEARIQTWRKFHI